MREETERGPRPTAQLRAGRLTRQERKTGRSSKSQGEGPACPACDSPHCNVTDYKRKPQHGHLLSEDRFLSRFKANIIVE